MSILLNMLVMIQTPECFSDFREVRIDGFRYIAGSQRLLRITKVC